MSKSLQELGTEIRQINAANGWAVTKPEEFADKYKFPAVLMLITSEVAEALEAFREGRHRNDTAYRQEKIGAE